MTLEQAISLGRNIIYGPLPKETDPIPTAMEALQAIRECQKRTPHTWLTGAYAIEVLTAHIEQVQP